MPGEYLVNDAGQIVYKIARNFPADLRAERRRTGPARNNSKGPQAIGDRKLPRLAPDRPVRRPARQRYLVNDQGQGRLSRRSRHQRHSSDPRPDGSGRDKSSTRPRRRSCPTSSKEFSATSCRGRSCLLGVMIAIVLEMSGHSFARFRRRRLSAARFFEPDLYRRPDPLAGRSLVAQAKFRHMT